MKTRLILSALLLVNGMLFQSCTDDSSPVETPPRTIEPPAWQSPGVHLAVGNTYHWRYTRISSFGNIFMWDENCAVTGETTIDGSRDFILSTGEKLKSQGDTVFAFTQNTISVFYSLTVSIGQAVPFLGNQLTVSFIDTSNVFGETQKIVSVLNQGDTPGNLFAGRYASRFGLIGIDRSEATYVIRGTLVGARIGTVNYGYAP